MGQIPVSVVIPAFNRPEMAARAVTSALRQEAAPAEVIVVDDCSSDDTGTRAEAAGARVIWHDVNGGESVARNTGVAAATQPWIAFLDSDDQWLPEHLSTLWAHSDDYVLIASSGWAQKEDGTRIRRVGVATDLPVHSPADVLVPGNPFLSSGALVRHDVLTAAGGFVPGMTRSSDADAWIRVLELGPGLVVSSPSLLYVFHDGQISADGSAMRRANRAMASAYEDREWFTPTLRAQLDACHAWNDLREAIRDGRYARAARAAWRALAGYQRIKAVQRLRQRHHLNDQVALASM